MGSNKVTSTLTNKVQQFIIEYIEDNTALDNVTVNEASNFVNEQLLDSFATLSMIMTLESEFSIKLSTAELTDEKMRVVGFLAESVARKISA
ncbi:acyl carrier protein [Colwellia sp. 1_MG-2023]|uniref:acyl carrier protein n=1 Tax=Colwellia sp. 1_MG-2023 TaxID=3062649 RepID=UPI0026E2B3EF|nr:acyl carrier protein [Colwellia sp. 1_MG-2023]MDO6444385.1 acyl carrier protein [Colwellia sp. 1_MG-2023]